MSSEYSYTLGTGENYLALDGLELDLPCNAHLEEEQVTILWDDYVEEDLKGLRRFQGKRHYN